MNEELLQTVELNENGKTQIDNPTTKDRVKSIYAWIDKNENLLNAAKIIRVKLDIKDLDVQGWVEIHPDKHS